MNRLYTLLAAFVFSIPTFAQLNGNGYYRVQSTNQERYISVVDNRGSVNLMTTSADMGALRTKKYFERVVSDPSSVIYIKKMNSGYDLQSQGTGSYSIISYEVRIWPNGDGSYQAYASKAGAVKYLMDEPITWMTSEEDELTGYLMAVGSPEGTEADWYILPVSASGDSYFGMTPTVSAGGSYYQTFYAAFPFTFSSSGMNAYTITKVDEERSAVVINELTSGVPSSTPVIVKCSSSEAVSNKINVGATASSSTTGNLLKGVYFCNDVTNVNHRNVLEYDSETMRVLGTASDGSLAFVKSSTLKYIPANTAYITVTENCPDELKVCTQAEYEKMIASKPGDLNGDGVVDVQDLGIIVKMILGSQAKTSAADLNNDGDVDVQDLGYIVKIILN